MDLEFNMNENFSISLASVEIVTSETCLKDTNTHDSIKKSSMGCIPVSLGSKLFHLLILQIFHLLHTTLTVTDFLFYSTNSIINSHGISPPSHPPPRSNFRGGT